MDLAPLARLHATHPDARRWVVAYSGGMDSRVLLELALRLRAQDDTVPPLLALHVDHRIHPDSPQWAAHCAEVCDALGVPFEQRDAEAGGARSEDALRRARYRVFETFCVPGDLLLLAHHLDDQAETVLLRLFRGAGPAGLGGMPAERPCGAAQLCRPLLAIRRAELQAYAQESGLVWIDDPANAAPRYGRNHLRHRVLPLIEERRAGATARIARTADNCAEAARLCTGRAAEDLAACLATDRFGQQMLTLGALRSVGTDRGRNLLREWLRQGGAGQIDAQVIDTLQGEVIEARADRQPRLVIGAVEVRRFGDALYRLAAEGPRPSRLEGFEIGPGLAREVAGVGRIALLPERSGGVRRGERYRIAFRRPGLRCRLAGRPERALKQILQEAGVPPWLRDRVPLLYVDGELAAIADLGVCEGFVAEAGEEGVRLSWAARASAGS